MQSAPTKMVGSLCEAIIGPRRSPPLLVCGRGASTAPWVGSAAPRHVSLALPREAGLRRDVARLLLAACHVFRGRGLRCRRKGRRAGPRRRMPGSSSPTREAPDDVSLISLAKPKAEASLLLPPPLPLLLLLPPPPPPPPLLLPPPPPPPPPRAAASEREYPLVLRGEAWSASGAWTRWSSASSEYTFPRRHRSEGAGMVDARLARLR